MQNGCGGLPVVVVGGFDECLVELVPRNLSLSEFISEYSSEAVSLSFPNIINNYAGESISRRSVRAILRSGESWVPVV
jgi:hypothetical protein